MFAMVRRGNSNFLKYMIIIYIHYILQARSSSLNCTFEDDFCEWKNETSDDFDWERETGGTSTYKTGPVSDHTTGGGYFIYTEANGRQNGHVARITSPLQEAGPYCLTFWYSMYGSKIGTLNVYMKTDDGKETVIFTKDTNIGIPDWKKAVISRSAFTEFKIVIEGVRGDANKGDIALDDIAMTDGLCSVDCDFDSGLCQWVQDDSDDFDWTWDTTVSNTDNTGPRADHTSGKGNYIYIDTSVTDNGDKAKIISPWQNAGKYCFVFWYHMYGTHVRTLKVLIDEDGEKATEIVRITKQQGDRWIQNKAFIDSTKGFQIIIQGNVRNDDEHDLGDIAIDDVLMLSCQDCGDPSPVNGKPDSTNFQYSSVTEITCNSGYYITENSTIVCQADGTWSGSPTCEPADSKNNAMIAVYVLVPVAAVAIVIAIVFIFWRKKAMKCLSALRESPNHTKEHPLAASRFSNATYPSHHNEIQTHSDDVLSEDTEYAIIVDDRNGKGEDENSVHISTVDAMITAQEKGINNCEHTPVSDNNYSHLLVEKDNVTSGYETISVTHPGKVSLQRDSLTTDNSHCVNNIKTSEQSQGTNLQSNMPSDRDPDYDHAKTEGIDPVDLDDYSHLNDKTENPKSLKSSETESSKLDNDLFPNVLKNTERNDITDETGKTACEQAIGETPQYFILEPENGDSMDDGRDYFVLEKEEERDS